VQRAFATSAGHLRLIVALVLLTALAVLAAVQFVRPAYQWWSVRRDAAAGNYTRAEKTLAQLLDLQPNNAQAHFLHGHILRKLRHFPEAQAELSKATSLGLPASAESQREGALLEASVNFRSSETSLLAFLDSTPADVELLQVVAKGYVSQMRWAKAEKCYSRWLQIDPDNLDALLGRGQARMRSERWNEAIADFQAILKQAPEHFHVRLLLADCLLNDFRMDEAEPELLICRQLRPDRPEPLIGLALCFTDKGNLEEAQKLLIEASSLEPGSALVVQNLGDFYMLRRRYDLAETMFSKLVQLSPRDGSANLKLAQALRKNGKEDQAQKYERRYLELLPPTPRR
jgi:Flp pilus assembly protein TadD